VPTRTEVIIGGVVLFGTSLAMLACVSAMVWWQRWRERPRGARSRAAQDRVSRYEAEALERAIAAGGAAEQARMRAQEAEQERAGAFDALIRVQREHDHAAGQYHRVAQQRAQWAGDGDGQRHLTHAAFEAYRRGDLSQEQLWRVWRLGSGWDEELERREHEVMRLRADRREAQLRYRAAASRARLAAREVEVAEARLNALIEEAAEAAGGHDSMTP
jgi:hypothetical protein